MSDAEFIRLRTEWLRLSGQLHDALTGLPTLPAVMEELRRLLARYGAVDVIYLDLGRSGQRESALGWELHDQMIRSTAARLNDMRNRGELAADDIICIPAPRSDRVILFRGTAPDEGLTELPARASGLVAHLLEQTDVPGAPPAGLASGHTRVIREPMARPERLLQRGVARAALIALRDRDDMREQRMRELDRMIQQGGVRSVFHPIVRIDNRQPIGAEALTRPALPHSFESVEAMFAFAEGTDRLLDFERVCRREAIRTARTHGLLFLNCSARALEDPEWLSPELIALLAEGGRVPNQVVLEVTERVAVRRDSEFRAAVRALRERGYRLAIDDMGAGFSTLQTLADLEPDFLKFDVTLVRDIHASRIKQSLLESLRGLGQKINARVIAEGVEEEEERAALQQLGVELGQGRLFDADEVGTV